MESMVRTARPSGDGSATRGVRMRQGSFALAAGVVASLLSTTAVPADAQDTAQVQRGKYLVEFGGCSDCHTPGTFLGKPDPTRYLAGSDVGFAIPGLGVFPGRNLTPDMETGIGAWSGEQIVAAIQTGMRPDGRMLAPIMPYADFAHLTAQDAMAIAAYLKSLPAIKNEVPGPFGPDEKVTVFVMPVLPADVYNSLPRPAGTPAK